MNIERGGLDLKAQVLLCPVTDATFDPPSYRQSADGYYLTRDGMIWFWDQHSRPEQRTEPHAAPLHTSSEILAELPTTLVITDEVDVLRDEGELCAAELREAGVDVTQVRVGGTVHDFLLLDSLRDTRPRTWPGPWRIDALRTALHG